MQDQSPARRASSRVATCRAAHKKSEDALNSTSAQAGDVADGADAKATLMGSLRTIQSAARTEFTLTDPERVKNYLVGQDIAANQTVLEASAQTILDQANADRPGSVNTDFISRVTGECSAVVDAKASKQSHRGSGKQQRADRKAMVKSIVARRKQIQYAADTSWPHTQPGTKKARVEFQLPAKRPFSY